ncbi:MAG: VWA domain-containing protein [Cocleimonas sp.]|nr:VWA domain-containing protein [Cocleimonas sp.]
MARKKRSGRKTKTQIRTPKKRSGMSFGKIIFFIAFAVIAYNIFNDTSSTTQTSPAEEVAVDASLNQGSYALRGSTNTWPDIQNTKNNIVPYSNQKDLLAKNYYIVLDASGSMKETTCADGKTKMKASIDALEQFLQGAPKDANYGLSVFHQGSFKELVKLNRQTDWKKAMQELRQKLVPDGGTPLASATKAAQKKLEEQGRKQLGYGEYNLVLITDGMAGHGEDPKAAVDLILQNTPLNLSVIGFCIGENNVLNQPGYIQYRTATDPKSLKESLQSVLAESPDFNVSDFSQ